MSGGRPVTPQARLRRCVVQVRLPDGSLRGSGFFAAPGVVVTCAHVVPGPGAPVTVWWGDLGLPATVEATFPASGRDGGDYHPFPDLAVIRLVGRIRDHPCVRFAETEPSPGVVVTASGFTTATPAAGPQLDSLLLTVAGPADRYLRVVADRVVPGFSGSPAADPRTGEVVGVVKASRDIGAVQGGWLTPVDAVLDVLGPDLVEENAAYHRRSVPLPLPPELADLVQAEQAAAETMPDWHLTGQIPSAAIYIDQSFGDLLGDRDQASPVQALRSREHLLVEGPPGAGKSTLLRYLVRLASNGWLAADETGADSADPSRLPLGAVVPVLVRAADLAGSALPDALAARPMGLLRGRLDPELFTRRPLPGVSWLVLVDGLDEISEERLRSEVIGRLAQHVASSKGMYRFLVTTRPLASGELTKLESVTGPAQRLRSFGGISLERFAQLWFTAHSPESAHADAATFLAEVDRAGLRHLLALPLLATIAAHLWTSDGAGRLPRSRYSLYLEFTRHLVHQRAAATRAHLAEHLGHLEVRGRSLTEVLLSQRDTLLEAVAREHVRDARASLLDVALSALDTADLLLPPDWPQAVRALLLGSGIVVHDRNGLTFLHRSFAEYLLAERIAEEVGPDREAIHPYIDAVIYPSTTSDLAHFVVERWGQRPDSDVGGVLSWYVLFERHRHALPAAVSLIECGLPAGGLLPFLVTRLSNRIMDGELPYAEALGRLVSNPEALDRIKSLVQDDQVAMIIRVRLTSILALFAQDHAERAAAVATLLQWIEDSPADPQAAYYAAVVFEAMDPAFSQQVLHRLVGGSDDWVRVLAAQELGRLGEPEEMTTVLRGVAADPAVLPWNRALAIKALGDLGDEDEAHALLGRLAAGPITGQPGWMKVAQLLEYDSRPDLWQRIAVQGTLPERIQAAVELRRERGHHPVASATVRALIDDPGIMADELLEAMLFILGEEEATRVLQEAADPAGGWWRAVGASTGLIRIGLEADGRAALHKILRHPEPAAWIATALALRKYADHERSERALHRMVRGREPATRRKIGPAAQVAAAIVLITEFDQDEWIGTVRKLAVTTSGILTSAQAILIEADVYGEIAARHVPLLIDLLDTAPEHAAALRKDAATTLLGTTDEGRERGQAELARLEPPGERHRPELA